MTNTYRAVVAPWAIYRRFGAVSRTCVGRFRHRADADGHLALIRQVVDNPLAYEVVWDPRQEDSNQG
jgi:hypothetical protein